MPEDKDLKRLIRARMAKTGESYTAARRELLKAGSPPPVEPDFEDVYSASVRNVTLPFDRLTRHARQAMSRAQAEARGDDRPGYIGTEHLLLGVMAVDGVGAHVVRNCGVTGEALRAAIAARGRARGHERAVLIKQIVPTSRLRAAIEVAFQEAHRLRKQSVGTEHLLLGILIQGEGLAAGALAELGADLERVYAEISRLEALRAIRSQGATGRAPEGDETTGMKNAREWLRGVLVVPGNPAHGSSPERERDALTAAIATIEGLVVYFLGMAQLPMPRHQRSSLVERLVNDLLGDASAEASD